MDGARRTPVLRSHSLTPKVLTGLSDENHGFIRVLIEVEQRGPLDETVGVPLAGVQIQSQREGPVLSSFDSAARSVTGRLQVHLTGGDGSRACGLRRVTAAEGPQDPTGDDG